MIGEARNGNHPVLYGFDGAEWSVLPDFHPQIPILTLYLARKMLRMEGSKPQGRGLRES